tara:strand:- start:4002 stop:4583 length:582 start_codon:yes stop_codon:yes gene_type:complete
MKIYISILISIVFLMACNSIENINPLSGENREYPFASAGRNIEVHAKEPQVVDVAYFVDSIPGPNGQLVSRKFELAPSASNKKLVLLDLMIVNRSSTVIPMLFDENAVRIGDRRGKRIEASNPYQISRELDLSTENNGTEVTQLVWGDIELPRQTQIGGTMVFEVPKGLLLGTLFWDEIEFIPIDYIDYNKNK